MGKEEKIERVIAVRHMLASIFASQKALRSLAPEFNWSGLGNLLGDFGAFVAIDHYKLEKAPSGSSGFDAITQDGKTVQIKANFAATRQQQQDTHSILDSHRSQGVGFAHSQTKELTDDPTQEGVDLAR